MEKKNIERVLSSATANSSNDSAPPENLENITLIWLDPSIDETADDYTKTLELLRQINHFLLTYTDSDSCINYIKTVDKEIVFLIVSGSLSKEILPEISAFQQVDSVFVFCSNRPVYEHLKEDYSSKVIDIFTEQNSLMISIRQRLHLVSKQITAFFFFNQKQKCSRDLTKESASFLWFQLLFSVLKEFPQSEAAKNDMLDKCTDYYHNNPVELQKIEDFRKHYKAEQAITWYTNQSFVYRLLNKALRTEDIDGLYFFRFYIIDLWTQLELESRKNVGMMIVYRGQRMIDEELKRLKQGIGSLISTNAFFSTTRDRAVAMDFVKSSKRHEFQSVLFEITADSSSRSSVFGNIERFSHYKEECEVLFGVGAVFKIESVHFVDAIGCWLVRMKLTDEAMIGVQDYIDATKNQYEDMTISVIFGRLLIETDELTKSKTYFNLLLRSTIDNCLEQADILDQLGRISYLRSEHTIALQHYNEAYQIRRTHLRLNHPKIGTSLDNIGCVYHWTADHENAINHFQRALDIFQSNYGNVNHINIANSLKHLGMAFRKRKHFPMALSYFLNSLDMLRHILPSGHSEIADCLWSIGIVNARQKYYDAALQYYFDALKIFEKTRPIGHNETSKLFYMIVDVYLEKGDYEVALDICQQKLNDISEILGDTHPSVGNLFLRIGDIFQKYTDNAKALSYYEKALVIFHQCNPPDLYNITHSLRRLALLQEQDQNFQLALDNYMKELKIKQKLYLADQPRVGCTLRNIGRMYFKLKNYIIAMDYLENALKIFRSHYSDDHDGIKSILECIVQVKEAVNPT